MTSLSLDPNSPGFWQQFIPKLQGAKIEDSDVPGHTAEIVSARVDGDMVVLETDEGWSFNMKTSMLGLSAPEKDPKTFILSGLGIQATITLP